MKAPARDHAARGTIRLEIRTDVDFLRLTKILPARQPAILDAENRFVLARLCRLDRTLERYLT